MPESWLNQVNWSDDGLVPAIVQEAGSGSVLMVAWMNREALRLTAETGEAVFWSRSRRKLWHKGEESARQHPAVPRSCQLLQLPDNYSFPSDYKGFTPARMTNLATGHMPAHRVDFNTSLDRNDHDWTAPSKART